MNEVLIYLINLLIGISIGYIVNRLKSMKVRSEAIEVGVQALLRDRMIQSYNHYYVDKGCCPIWAKESFANCYNAYHNLGANGVIDDIFHKVMSLPTEIDEQN